MPTTTSETSTHKTAPKRSSERETKKPSSSSSSSSPSSKRAGGVAPFVRPPSRWQRLRAAQGWKRRGFVPMMPAAEKRRHRILPRSVIGIASMLMALGIGAAFSGAAFYAYYDDRLAENEREIATFVDGFDQQFQDAAGALSEIGTTSVEQIRSEMAPLGEWVSDANGVVNLPVTIGESVWIVETRDEDGASSVGAAFAVTGHQGGTALVTSLSVVRAATQSPAPTITLVKGERREAATLYTWDNGNDLAVLVTSAEIPALEMATPTAQGNAIGRRLFAMSGFGSQGATASPGALLDVGGSGLQHTAAVGTVFRGGPLVTGDGIVVGVASTAYRPLGFDPGAVGQAAGVEAICDGVLRCADLAADTIVGDLTLGEPGAAVTEGDG